MTYAASGLTTRLLTAYRILDRVVLHRDAVEPQELLVDVVHHHWVRRAVSGVDPDRPLVALAHNFSVDHDDVAAFDRVRCL